jgi:hypothetical protein
MHSKPLKSNRYACVHVHIYVYNTHVFMGFERWMNTLSSGMAHSVFEMS